MRGLATATFFLSTTLIGLGLGPFMAGYVSATNADDLSMRVLSTLVAVPVGQAYDQTVVPFAMLIAVAGGCALLLTNLAERSSAKPV